MTSVDGTMVTGNGTTSRSSREAEMSSLTFPATIAVRHATDEELAAAARGRSSSK